MARRIRNALRRLAANDRRELELSLLVLQGRGAGDDLGW